MSNRAKKSFIAGALTSTAGVFISKLLGLLYVAPFTALATTQNTVFYSLAYTNYDIFLNICTAGIPFAIATMVAKYYDKKDYKTVILIRKLSIGLMMVAGFTAAILFISFSTPMAKMALGSNVIEQDLNTLRTVYCIMALAIAIVPFLSSIRGYYQGLKELGSYAFSQVLEQLMRVFSLLLLGFILVKVIQLDAIYAVYMAVLATSIGAISAIVYYMFFDRNHYPQMKSLAANQKTEEKSKKYLLKELFYFGLPYFIVAILGNSMNIVNNNFFISAAQMANIAYDQAKVILSIITLQCDKLTSIPQVFSIGFSTGIIPYITVALENHNYKELSKNILDCLDTVLYLALPLCFCLLYLSKPIYYLMYGNGTLDLGSELLAWSSLIGLCGTITPICSSMMMALRLRKLAMVNLLIGFAVKLITFFPLIILTGYTGAITSSVLTSIVIITLDLWMIKKKFKINYKRVVRRLLFTFIGILSMGIVFKIMYYFNIGPSCVSRIQTFFELAILGICGISVYFGCTYFLQLPQEIFRMDLQTIMVRLKGKK